MKAIILAAGYGTRLQAIVKDLPKALIEIGGQTILDYLFDQLRSISEIDGYYLATNSKFYNHFKDWQKLHPDINIEILDDKTSSNDERLGAVGDLHLIIDHFNIQDDILVCAADTIVQPRLVPFIESFKNKPTTWICARREPNKEDRKHRGIISVDNEMRVISFIEKPSIPQSDLAAVPFYVYPKEIIPLIKDYLVTGGVTDAPGHFVAWLYERTPVYVYNIDGQVIDIGNPESLIKARNFFSL